MRALVLCFHPQLHHAHVICYFRLKITSFMSFILVFLCVFREKNLCCNHNNALYGWYTWQRKRFHDFWWVASKELTFANLVSVETAYPQNFIVYQQLTSFPPVFKCHRLHMRTMSKQAKLNPFLLTFSTLELSNTTNMNKHKIKKHTNPNISKP